MAIYQSSLRNAASRPLVEVAKSINEARQRGRKSAFLCHSHADRELVKGFVRYAADKGWSVYIDWQDTSLPSIPDGTTASKIRDKIISADLFLFFATQNSVSSRWCPWEIGYADGKKAIDQILIIPTIDDGGRHHGNEYLQLYRKLDEANDGRLAAFRPGQTSGVYATSL